MKNFFDSKRKTQNSLKTTFQGEKKKLLFGNNQRNERWLRGRKTNKGSIALEWVICAPVAFTMVFFSLMFTIFMIDYYCVSNICSSLAQEMNMIDSGYEEHKTNNFSLTMDSYKTGVFLLPDKTGEKTLTYENGGIKTTNSEPFKKTFNYFLNEYKKYGYFNIPFACIEEIEGRVYYDGVERTGFNISPDTTESGDVIRVKITFNYLGLFKMKTVGYSFII